MTRLLDVARIQLVNWRIAVVLPLGILAMVLVLNLVLHVTLTGMAADGDFTEGFTTGGVSAIYIFATIIALQSVTQLFPFVLGLSVTRRAFYAATSLYAVAQAMVFGLLLTLCLALERATDGWGVGMGFFRFAMPLQENPIVHWLIFTAILLVFSGIGLVFGVVYKRWGQLGMYATLVGFAVLVTAVAVLITWLGAWLAVAAAVVSQPPLALGIGYPVLLAVLLGGLGWLGLRRATG